MSTEALLRVPFFRPELGEAEIAEVVATLRSGWLTTGPRVRRFEHEFAQAVGARYAVALNSCTAALHLAVEALGLKAGQAVLVPTMTFAATAEIVRYQNALPVLVDCDPVTGHIDLQDAERKIASLASAGGPPVVGILPVHVGGLMLDLDAVRQFAAHHQLWVVEDAAHAFPAGWRAGADRPWQRCGENTAAVSCFSFYANKTISTGEGGMAVTDSPELADRMRLMSLHGLSRDAWERYAGGASWDYQIVATGFKYNMTDIAAALGIHQLARADQMRRERERIATRYLEAFAAVDTLELPPTRPNTIHAWHLFPVRLRLERLEGGRNHLFDLLRDRGVACSVHWRPLHLHPYYQLSGITPANDPCPAATALFERIISLPLFSSMTGNEVEHVITTVTETLSQSRL